MKETVTSFLKGNSAYGVDFVFSAEGGMSFYFVELAKNKDEIEILRKEEGNSLDTFLDLKLENRIPIYLNIRGKGVLTKKIETDKDITLDSKDLLRKALPNAKEEEFYYTTDTIGQGEFWLSLVRKEQVDKLFNQFKKRAYSLVSIFLGYSEIGKLANILPDKKITIGEIEVHFEENKIQEIQPSVERAEKIRLGEELISTNYLLAFSSAFNHFAPQGNTKILSKQLQLEESEYIQKRLFSFGLKAVLSFFLFLLLINFFFFQHYNEKNNVLSEKLLINQSQLNKLQELKKEKKSKEQFFLKTDLISTSHNSYYADRLALTRLKGISWDELNINPPTSKVEKGEEIEFAIKQINLVGTASDSRTLNDWIAILDKEEWIASINIKDFHREERKSTSMFNLLIEVK